VLVLLLLSCLIASKHSSCTSKNVSFKHCTLNCFATQQLLLHSFNRQSWWLHFDPRCLNTSVCPSWCKYSLTDVTCYHRNNSQQRTLKCHFFFTSVVLQFPTFIRVPFMKFYVTRNFLKLEWTHPHPIITIHRFCVRFYYVSACV
jgi:hypothetical protein